MSTATPDFTASSPSPLRVGLVGWQIGRAHV